MAGFDFNGGRTNRRKQEQKEYEFYEDTHNERGEYIGRQLEKSEPPTQAKPLPVAGEQVSARNYQNVVVYEPTNGDDVERLIDYLKRREPAIVNLDSLEADDAQRILDFVSGAIYALNGSVHRVSSNIFLLSPEGVEITVPYDPN